MRLWMRWQGPAKPQPGKTRHERQCLGSEYLSGLLERTHKSYRGKQLAWLNTDWWSYLHRLCTHEIAEHIIPRTGDLHDRDLGVCISFSFWEFCVMAQSKAEATSECSRGPWTICLPLSAIFKLFNLSFVLYIYIYIPVYATSLRMRHIVSFMRITYMLKTSCSLFPFPSSSSAQVCNMFQTLPSKSPIFLVITSMRKFLLIIQ